MKIIPISGVIGYEVMPASIRAQLDAAAGEDVQIQISSPGGFVFDGLEIFNLIRNYKGKVTTHLMGLAASMGSYLAMAGQRVTAEDNSVFMIHNAWALAIGDYNAMRETADMMEGLTNVLALAYQKKTGKDMKKIRSMMDDETYLFGDEIVAEGFVDEIVKTENKNPKEKAEAFVTSKAIVQNCIKTMALQEKAKNDLTQAAACIGEIKKSEKAKPETESIILSQTHGGTMTLEELLQANPNARAEHNAQVAAARTEGLTAGRAEKDALINGVKNYLGENAYPKAFRNLAVQVLTGEKSMAALDGAVTIFDATEEEKKSALAKKETGKNKETPGQGEEGQANLSPKTPEEFKAAADRLKGK